jgi:hypothetical protein
MALSPEAEKKGIVAIRPKVVVVTTNALTRSNPDDGGNSGVNSDLNAVAWSCAPGAYLRRFDFAISVAPRVTHMEGNTANVSHRIDWANDGPEFWKFRQLRYRLSDGYSCVRTLGEEYRTMEEMLLKLSEIAITHKWAQKKFVSKVIGDLDEPLCNHNLIRTYCQTCRNELEPEYESQALYTEEIVPEYPTKAYVTAWNEVIPALRFVEVVEFDCASYTRVGKSGNDVTPRKEDINKPSIYFQENGVRLCAYVSKYAEALTALEFLDVVIVDNYSYTASRLVFDSIVSECNSQDVSGIRYLQLFSDSVKK